MAGLGITEIVDHYVSLGCRAIFLRPIDPFGFVGKTARVVEYDRAAYRDFYRAATDHIIALNESHLRRLIREYISYYHADRTHHSLEKDPPAIRPVLTSRIIPLAYLQLRASAARITAMIGNGLRKDPFLGSG